jgi:hypothetical protein
MKNAYTLVASQVPGLAPLRQPFAELKSRGATFGNELSFIDEGLWGFEVTDADGVRDRLLPAGDD